MRREAGEDENFFIAKYRDSESAQSVFSRHRRVAKTSIARRSRNALMEETPAAQAFHTILTIADVGVSCAIRVVARMHRGVADQRVARALASARQHFLKRDAVFLDVLVYSGCSAFRFPSARSD
jgi:hypothetical protein